ncbi:hypothetical protein J7J26_00270 [Candidatus Micrarchaeota archaeon]|nr:hypothetical protein [Candidatus Micrarchaeota archaeon]
MLKPTMRLKQRYVLFKVQVPKINHESNHENNLSYEEIHRLIYGSLRSLYGDVGVYPMGYRIMEYDEKTGYGIVRFSRRYIMEGIAALALITERTDKTNKTNKIRLTCIGTSGTIKKLKEKYILSK